MISTKHPFISVIVPVYNREKSIRACIESLLSLSYPKDKIEIIVVDNGSSDNTAKVISEYPITSIQEKKRGAASARNSGIEISKGEILAFTDSDCLVEGNWAVEIAASFGDRSVSAVIGFSRGIDHNLCAAFVQRRYEAGWFTKTANGYSLSYKAVDTRNSALRREVVGKCGMFDPEMKRWEDIELGMRLNSLGYKIHLNPEMIVHHYNPTNISDVTNKKEGDGSACFQIIKSHPYYLYPRSVRKYFIINNMKIDGIKLELALLFVSVVAFLSVNLVKIVLALKRDTRLGFKIYSFMDGTVWEKGMLKATKKHYLCKGGVDDK